MHLLGRSGSTWIAIPVLTSRTSADFVFSIHKKKDDEDFDDGITAYDARMFCTAFLPTAGSGGQGLQQLTARWVGTMLVHLVDRNKCYPILDALDARSGELYDLGQEAFNISGHLRHAFRTGAWAPRPASSRPQHSRKRRRDSDDDELDTGGLLILDNLRVVPAYRGHKYGLRLVQYVLARLHKRHSLALLKPGFYCFYSHDQEEQQAWTKEQREEKWRKQLLYWQKAGFRRIGISGVFGRPSDHSHPVHATPILDDSAAFEAQEVADTAKIEAEIARLTAWRATGMEQERQLADFAHNAWMERLGPAAEEEEETDLLLLHLWYPYACEAATRQGLQLWRILAVPQYQLKAWDHSERRRQMLQAQDNEAKEPQTGVLTNLCSALLAPAVKTLSTVAGWVSHATEATVRFLWRLPPKPQKSRRIPYNSPPISSNH